MTRAGTPKHATGAESAAEPHPLPGFAYRARAGSLRHAQSPPRLHFRCAVKSPPHWHHACTRRATARRGGTIAERSPGTPRNVDAAPQPSRNTALRGGITRPGCRRGCVIARHFFAQVHTARRHCRTLPGAHRPSYACAARAQPPRPVPPSAIMLHTLRDRPLTCGTAWGAPGRRVVRPRASCATLSAQQLLFITVHAR